MFEQFFNYNWYGSTRVGCVYNIDCTSKPFNDYSEFNQNFNEYRSLPPDIQGYIMMFQEQYRNIQDACQDMPNPVECMDMMKFGACLTGGAATGGAAGAATGVVTALSTVTATAVFGLTLYGAYKLTCAVTNAVISVCSNEGPEVIETEVIEPDALVAPAVLPDHVSNVKMVP